MKPQLYALLMLLTGAIALAQVQSATVATLTALRALNTSGLSNGAYVWLVGRLTDNDGGEGPFIWHSSSAASDDDGITIQPTGVATGRWVRSYSGPVHAEWWGTSDYGASISSAVAAVRSTGGTVVVNANASGIASSPINITNCLKGVTIIGNGGNENSPLFIARHTGQCAVDLTGSIGVSFYNFHFGTGTNGDNFPKVGYLLARSNSNGSAENHKFYNSGTHNLSQFTVAALYNYGSEVDEYHSCSFYNQWPGGHCAVFTTTNKFSITSPSITIATGVQSTTVHHIYGGQWKNNGGATSDVFYIDYVEDFHVYGGFIYAPSGRAGFHFDTTFGGSVNCSFDGLRFETDLNPVYGFYWDNASTEHPPVQMSFANTKIFAGTNTLYVADGVTAYDFYWNHCWDANNKGVSIYNATCSVFSMLNQEKFTSRTGGTMNSCLIESIPSAVTINGTNAGTRIFDPSTGMSSTNTNDDAPSGYSREYLTGTLGRANRISLVSGTASNITSVSLTGGDWEVDFQAVFLPTATTTRTVYIASVSTVSATIGDTDGGARTEVTRNGTADPNVYDDAVQVLTQRISVPAGTTTTAYGVAYAIFGTNSLSAYGFIRARRL